MLDNRFWSKVIVSKVNFYNTTPCWEWTAYLNYDGYGQFQLNRKPKLAHRLSYEDKYGEIPAGLEINHLCRNRCCINREGHLEAITHKENCEKSLSGFAGGLRQRAKTHCPHGHEYSKENTYFFPNGKRMCRTCHRIRSRQNRQRKKQNQS